MMLKRCAAILLFLPVLFALQGCSTNPATGQQSFTAFMTPQQELRIGRKENPKIIKQFGGVYADKALAAYIRNVGLKLAHSSERPNLPWSFTVLNSTQVNAFAVPGGYIYITRGLLALLSNEAELAGVLSHEIGHITARHAAQRYSTTLATNLGVQLFDVLSKKAGLGRAGRDLASLGSKLALKGYSREQEAQSDRLAIRYMTRNGYDPYALVSFFKKLLVDQAIEAERAGRNPQEADRSNMMATHPRTVDRIRQAIRLARIDGTKLRKRNADEYLKHIDGLLFGNDPEQGLVRGSTFIDPKLNIRFKVPQTFTIRNLPSLVLATEKSGATIKFAQASTQEIRNVGGMEPYLLHVWSRNIPLQNIEWLNINAMKAITGEGEVLNAHTTIDVRRIVIEQNKTTYWRFQFAVPARDAERLNIPLRQTTYSLRAPTRAEIADAQPLRVHVVKVVPGITVRKLIASMAVPKMKAKWFQALNGLKPGDPLALGQELKIIE